MDILSAPGGLLIAFAMAGILLPIVGSFVLDGMVFLMRGRGPKTLIIATVLFAATLLITAFAWQQGTNEAAATEFTAGSIVDTMSGALLLMLFFSVPLAILAFASRMLTRYLNPAKRATEVFIAQARRERIAARKHHAPAEATAALTKA